MEFDSKSYIQNNLNLGAGGQEQTCGNQMAQMAQMAASSYMALFYRKDFWRGLDATIPSTDSCPQGVLGEFVKRICPMEETVAARIGAAAIYLMTHTDMDIPPISEMISNGQLEDFLKQGARELLRHAVKPATVKNCALFIGEPLTDAEIGKKVKANIALRNASLAAGVNQ